MITTFPKIAVLTGNNFTESHHLIRLVRSEFHDVIVISPESTKTKYQTVRNGLANAWKIARLLVKKKLFGYDYLIIPIIRTKPTSDIKVNDINSQIVYETLEKFSPDIICIYGTQQISQRILDLAPNGLNIHDGFAPYYRSVSSGYWVSLESNFSYLSYSIHKATSTVGAGDIYRSEPVSPYFFESLEDHQYRQSIAAVIAMVETVKDLASGKDQSFEQPDLGIRNFKRKHKPNMFALRSSQSFDSNNASLYKRTTPRTGRIENFFVKRLPNRLPKTMANGWFIVNYHAIVNSENFHGEGLPRMFTELNRFREHMDMYSDEFNFISISDGLRQLESGIAKNTRSLSITFDDSLRLPDQVIELFKSNGIKPTLFLNSNPVIRQIPLDNHMKYLRRIFSTLKTEQHFKKWIKSQYLNVDDVHRLTAEGVVEIGSHTASHSRLNHKRAKDMETEITVAHKELEQHLQLNIDYFAFPFGGLSDRSFLAEYQAMQTANYYFACNGGVNQHLAPGALLRIGVHNECEKALKNLLLSQHVR